MLLHNDSPAAMARCADRGGARGRMPVFEISTTTWPSCGPPARAWPTSASSLAKAAASIAGQIDRLRKAGDARFAPRPAAPRKVRVIKPPGESVGNRHRQVAAEPAPRPATLADLRPGRCRFPVSDPPPGHGVEMLFCSEAVARPGANYCSRHAELARSRVSSSASSFSPRAPGQLR